MIEIKIKHKTKNKKNKLLPPNLYGLPYGQFYIMLGSKEENPSYFMTTGSNSNPIMFWWSTEDDTYQVTPAELDGYAKHIYVELVEAELVMELEICG